VAVSDSAQRVATPVSAIQRGRDRDGDHLAIARLVEDYGAVGVVVGLPVSLSGLNGPAALAVLEEVEMLRGRVGVKVDVIDERFTTVTASSALHDAGRGTRDQRALVDQTAAAVLLQDWIDQQLGRGNSR
jgi:putative Holliday junction resolvase